MTVCHMIQSKVNVTGGPKVAKMTNFKVFLLPHCAYNKRTEAYNTPESFFLRLSHLRK